LSYFSNSRPQPTARTQQVLRQYDLTELQEKEPEIVLARLAQFVDSEPSPANIYAFAELAHLNGIQARDENNEDVALDLFCASVAHCYHYLFDSRFEHTRNPYDPVFRGACDLYNTSLEGALRIINKREQLRPGVIQSVHSFNDHFDISIVMRGPWKNDEFEHFEFASDYEVKGLRNSHRNYGLGVPLIAVRKKGSDEDPAERYYPEGLSLPVTAFVRVLPRDHTQVNNLNAGHRWTLELYDPLVVRDVNVNGHPAPLENDLTTPLAYYLNDPVRKTSALATFTMLNANFAKQLSGLHMLEPYRPDKIPVLMVHGFWSSPATWMEMFNDLRADPAVRDKFQFWFYLYPSGQPFWLSAQQLRQDLADMQQRLDPQQRSIPLKQMVLVGHSMGGLIAKLQTLNSSDDFWRMLSDKPIDQLNVDKATRQKLVTTLYFTPNPSIRRVVTIASPHRGSSVANTATRWLGNTLLTLPEAIAFANDRMMRDNPNYFRDTRLLTIRTSIDAMSPSCPIFPVMLQAQKAPWVKYHNVVGRKPNQGYVRKITEAVAGEGDGVVSLASAHLEDVESEITVEGEHMTIHEHPRSILYIRRILLEHLDELKAERVANQNALRRERVHDRAASPSPLR